MKALILSTALIGALLMSSSSYAQSTAAARTGVSPAKKLAPCANIKSIERKHACLTVILKRNGAPVSSAAPGDGCYSFCNDGMLPAGPNSVGCASMCYGGNWTR